MGIWGSYGKRCEQSWEMRKELFQDMGFRGKDNRGVMAKEIVWREWRVEKEKVELERRMRR